MHRFVVFAAFAACSPERLAPPAGEAEAARFTEDVVLAFAADWTESASAAITPGAKVRVVYDPARLPQCRGTKYGYEAWAISGYWRVNGGATSSFTAYLPGRTADDTFVVPESTGELELWFSNNNAFGCIAWDSNYGGNYRFPVVESGEKPDWMGNATVAIGGAACDGGPCGDDVRPLGDGFLFDTWARQSAEVAELAFQVWEPGVTDFDNPDLWRDLDVRVHWGAPGGEVGWDWVSYDGRVGNDARYILPIPVLDPLGATAALTDPEDCPEGALRVSEDAQYVELDQELYFSVNGYELRAAGGEPFVGTFRNYRGLFEVCPNQP